MRRAGSAQNSNRARLDFKWFAFRTRGIGWGWREGRSRRKDRGPPSFAGGSACRIAAAGGSTSTAAALSPPRSTERRDRFALHVAHPVVLNGVPREAAPLPFDKLLGRVDLHEREGVDRAIDWRALAVQSIKIRPLPRTIPKKQPDFHVPLRRPGPRDAASPAPFHFFAHPMTSRPNRATEYAH